MITVKTLGTKAQLNELTAKAEERLKLGNIVRNLVASNQTVNQPNMRPCLKCGEKTPLKDFKWITPTNGDPRYQACRDCATGNKQPQHIGGINSMTYAFEAIAN